MRIASLAELATYAADIASQHTHLLLSGELGAGKTSFVQWYAASLWINPQYVQSPTYTYLHVYDEKLLHIDMYRINDPYQIINIELPALIETYPYVIIERPKFLELYSEFPRHHLAITKISDTEREINVLPM